jgi:hypothetical protein
VWAGAITTDSASELIEGPAATGMIGDFYMRNNRTRFVIQAPTRVIGVIPQGGNLVDAVLLDDEGNQVTGDHFGELSFVYLVGRTCEHETLEVVQDGSGGGAAVLRARGLTAPNDFINLRGMGLLNIPLDLDPDIDDRVECATTYILHPDSTVLEVRWTLFNPNDTAIRAPFAAFTDTGGDVESWGAGRGFERLGIEAITSAADPAPVDYVVYQGKGVAYGALPRHAVDATNSTFLVAGVSVLLYGATNLLDILNPDTFYLYLPAEGGVTHALDFVVGRDASDVEEQYRLGRGDQVAELSGSVDWLSGGAAEGARVGVFADTGGGLGADNAVITYMDVGADGSFSARLAPGNYLLRADVQDVAYSEARSVTVPAQGVDFVLPDPVYYEYSILDDETDEPIPGKLTVIGRHPAPPDSRLFETYDGYDGLVRMEWSIRGGTTDIGDGADAPFPLPAGGTYRIIATRGTEWSIDSVVVTPQANDIVQDVELRLRRVLPTEGYVSTEWHVHMIGSPDSPVDYHDRVATFVADGVEVWAATEHDYVSDVQPLVEQLGLERYTRVIPGLEVTPFTYGHFNAWPIVPDTTSPNRGAVDWARGADGYALIPSEIFGILRGKGAELIQVNHPRAGPGGITDFQQYFDRAGLVFDYEARTVGGDLFEQPVPNDWMRLPEAALWDDGFNALEVWNGFGMVDSNEDGVREIGRLDTVLRDWFNFLSFGMDITPIGSSDTHTMVRDPGGMPRTYVRVTDDSPEALASGTVVEDVLATLSGADGAPRDVVVSNGPHLAVRVQGEEQSALGRTIDGTSGSVTFEITAWSPEWAEFDTIEVFANQTPPVGKRVRVTALEPLACFTARDMSEAAENDTCANASLGGAQPLDVDPVEVENGHYRYQATVSFTLTPGDLDNRAGATGDDAWIVVRVRGDVAIFPLLLSGVMNDSTIDTLVSGSDEERRAIRVGRGVPAQAFTAPIYVDFDGGGYRAIFSPQ